MPSFPPGGEHAGAIPAPGSKKYTLLGADRRPYLSETPAKRLGPDRDGRPEAGIEHAAAVRALLE